MIGERIRELRQSQGHSLADIAGKAKISVATLSRIENDKQSVDLGLFLVLTKVLQVAPHELLEAEHEGEEDGVDPLARRIAMLETKSGPSFGARSRPSAAPSAPAAAPPAPTPPSRSKRCSRRSTTCAKSSRSCASRRRSGRRAAQPCGFHSRDEPWFCCFSLLQPQAGPSRPQLSVTVDHHLGAYGRLDHLKTVRAIFTDEPVAADVRLEIYALPQLPSNGEAG
jgi:transcriptional regulator with XRE-family HTH domain